MNAILNTIENLTDQAMLTEIVKLIDSRIEEVYDEKENFMYHDEIDDYIYVVYYLDRKVYYCKGKEAYENYIRDDEALSVYRKTKDLFPTYELLLEKY